MAKIRKMSPSEGVRVVKGSDFQEPPNDGNPLDGYRVMVIQYPYGYSRHEGTYVNKKPMATGHIEAVLIDKDGNYVNELPDGRKGYINRWVDEGNKPVTYEPQGHYEKGVRTAIISLTPSELEHFVDVAQTFTPGERTLGIPTAPGGKSTDYDLADSNCATGVACGLGIDPDSNENWMQITDPTIVMDEILKRGVDMRTGERVDMGEGVGRLWEQYVEDPYKENIAKPIGRTEDKIHDYMKTNWLGDVERYLGIR